MKLGEDEERFVFMFITSDGKAALITDPNGSPVLLNSSFLSAPRRKCILITHITMSQYTTLYTVLVKLTRDPNNSRYTLRDHYLIRDRRKKDFSL